MDASLPREERRRADRQPVNRRVLFSGEDGALRMGEIVDSGSGGMCIRTDTPAPVGTEVDIEVHSGSGGWTGGLLLRARVIYSSCPETTMGVRILPDRRRGKSLPPRPHVTHSAPHQWTPVPRKVTAPPAAKNKRLWPWLVPPAALAMLLLLFLFRLQDLSMMGVMPGADASGYTAAALGTAPALPDATDRPSSKEGGALSSADLAVSTSSDADLLHPIRPVPPMRLEDFKSVEGTLASVTYASAGGNSGTVATTPGDGMPWIYAQSSDEGAQAALIPESEWQARPEAAQEQKEGKNAPDEVLIVVEKSAHRLVLYRNGKVLRTFDIGLGRNNSTPEGDFRIAVKATNPAWKHKGRIIPGGSPENRIGKRWMALGKDKKVTSYGIHPAKNTRAIGGNTSFGCIQMYPDDADTLFRFCPIGTRVNIRV
ncbi:MAG: L,D-transpeptidase family protein [FCB group bacterium]|nr:L,D-transpeptidase family protein [FCB group bacterium]